MILLDCPECGGPLEISDQLQVGSFQCARLVCLYGHTYIAHAEWLADHGIFLQDPGDIVSTAFSSDPEEIMRWLNQLDD